MLEPNNILFSDFGGKKIFDTGCDETSDTSRISASSMRAILESIQQNKNRPSTKAVYMSVWRKFNKFVVRLDDIPQRWEERTSLYVGYLISKGTKSATIKSYISAIKSVLADDNYEWSKPNIEFASLTKGCKLMNDRVRTRLPITLGLLEIILREMEMYYAKKGQLYLTKLYQCMLLLGYYGLLRIGEMAEGNHAVKAANVHAAENKRKIMIILFSSKTHGLESHPQQIRIWADYEITNIKYCPFKITNEYGNLRGEYMADDEQFFVFQDGSPVQPRHLRSILKKCLKLIGLDATKYDTHSLRIGRASDLMKNGYTVDQIKQLGRWKSNAVYKYIRNS